MMSMPISQGVYKMHWDWRRGLLFCQWSTFFLGQVLGVVHSLLVLFCEKCLYPRSLSELSLSDCVIFKFSIIHVTIGAWAYCTYHLKDRLSFVLTCGSMFQSCSQTSNVQQWINLLRKISTVQLFFFTHSVLLRSVLPARCNSSFYKFHG